MTVRRAPSQFVPADRAGAAVTPTCGGCCCCCCCAGTLVGLSVGVPLATWAINQGTAAQAVEAADPAPKRSLTPWVVLGAFTPLLALGLAYASMIIAPNVFVALALLLVVIVALSVVAVGAPRKRWAEAWRMGVFVALIAAFAGTIEFVVWMGALGDGDPLVLILAGVAMAVLSAVLLRVAAKKVAPL